MRDLGLVTFDEPVTRLFPQGMVHKDGAVMSKSRGNTVAPDDIIARYGADTLRLYVLFVAPPEMALEWADEQIEGPHRFLQRLWRLVDRHADALKSEIRTPIPADLPESARALRRKVHQTIARVTEDIEERIHLNTAVAAMMELLNEVLKREADVADGVPRAVLREAIETLILLLSPFTPHVCEEMWERLGRRFSVVDRNWPAWSPEIAREDEVELAVQVNGKVRTRLTVPQDLPAEDVKARAGKAVEEHTAGKTIVNVVYVAGRLVNVVVK